MSILSGGKGFGVGIRGGGVGVGVGDGDGGEGGGVGGSFSGCEDPHPIMSSSSFECQLKV